MEALYLRVSLGQKTLPFFSQIKEQQTKTILETTNISQGKRILALYLWEKNNNINIDNSNSDKNMNGKGDRAGRGRGRAHTAYNHFVTTGILTYLFLTASGMAGRGFHPLWISSCLFCILFGKKYSWLLRENNFNKHEVEKHFEMTSPSAITVWHCAPCVTMRQFRG